MINRFFFIQNRFFNLIPGKINLAQIQFSHKSLSSCSTQTKDQNIDRTKFHVKNLFEHKLLPSQLVPSGSINNLESKINTILQRFDYEIYQQSIFHEFFDDQKLKFELQPYELFQILSAKNDCESQKLLEYFVSNKFQNYKNHVNKTKASQERKKLNQEKYLDNNRSGLWNDQLELKYGLWHNCLFTKLRRSSMSHLYDRRLLSNGILCPSTPRLWIDLDFVPEHNFILTRKTFAEIRVLLAFNKYKSKQPFRIEFIRSQTSNSSSYFNKIFSQFLKSWNDPEQFQYMVHRKNPSKLSEINSPSSPLKKLIYFSPTAKKALKMSELLDYSNIFVIPGCVSKSLRDPIFSKINNLPLSSSNIQVRRLPTFEHVVWNKFHGVISWPVFFSILHDMRFNIEDDWLTVFKRYLLHLELIKSDEELRQDFLEKHKSRMKRQSQIDSFISNNGINYRFPNQTKSFTVKDKVRFPDLRNKKCK